MWCGYPSSPFLKEGFYNSVTFWLWGPQLLDGRSSNCFGCLGNVGLCLLWGHMLWKSPNLSSPEVFSENLLRARRKIKLLHMHHPAVLSAAAHLKLEVELLKRNQTSQSGVVKHMRLVNIALLWSSERKRGKDSAAPQFINLAIIFWAEWQTSCRSVHLKPYLRGEHLCFQCTFRTFLELA